MVGLSDAEFGWVGSSADALVNMADKWQQVADKHHDDLTRQATYVAETAQAFQSAEKRNATELERVGDQADAVS